MDPKIDCLIGKFFLLPLSLFLSLLELIGGMDGRRRCQGKAEMDMQGNEEDMKGKRNGRGHAKKRKKKKKT